MPFGPIDPRVGNERRKRLLELLRQRAAAQQQEQGEIGALPAPGRSRGGFGGGLRARASKTGRTASSDFIQRSQVLRAILEKLGPGGVGRSAPGPGQAGLSIHTPHASPFAGPVRQGPSDAALPTYEAPAVSPPPPPTSSGLARPLDLPADATMADIPPGYSVADLPGGHPLKESYDPGPGRPRNPNAPLAGDALPDVAGPSSQLIPLGNGTYFDPATGQIHGVPGIPAGYAARYRAE